MTMRKFLVYAVMTAITITFYGCPVGSEYPLGKPGTEKIDKALIGTWKAEGNMADLTISKVKIKKKNDYSYSVEILEPGDAYMEEIYNYTGYVTELDGRKFVYFLAEGSTSYYLYHYEVRGSQVITHDVGLLVGGKDAVTSTEAYRKEVSESLKKPDCLSEEIVYNKAN